MLSWARFQRVQPDLSDAGRMMLYQHGVGLAFLSTVRRDGGPRLHPICPLFVDDRLLAFIIPSPKRDDLLRDGRIALHSFPRENDEDAFYLTGHAELVSDEPLRTKATEVYGAERGWLQPPADFAGQLLFEFFVEACLLTRTTGHGDPQPQHTVWKAPREA
jgi:hypothetical protein